VQRTRQAARRQWAGRCSTRSRPPASCCNLRDSGLELHELVPSNEAARRSDADIWARCLGSGSCAHLNERELAAPGSCRERTSARAARLRRWPSP
jgi:hypothetical protein